MIRMLKPCVLVLVAALFAAGQAPGAQAPQTNAAPAVQSSESGQDPVVARGIGVRIKRSEVDQAVARAKAQVAAKGRTASPEQITQMGQQVLEQLINVQLVSAKATDADKAAGKTLAAERLAKAKAKAGSDAAFEQEMKRMGVTQEELLARWTEALTGEAVLKREFKINITERDAKKFYDENPSQFNIPESVRASHILLLTRDPKTGAPLSEEQKAAKLKLIEEILKRARAGEDFAKLAREYSEDTASKDQGGEYKSSRGKILPEIEAAVFALKTNEISGVVTSTHGYHIIKLNEKFPPHKIEYAAAASEIQHSLTQKAIEERFPDYIVWLRGQAKVEILDESLKPKDPGFQPTEAPSSQKKPQGS
jgi:parvulin-like peptidyl-prolyl isomerase